MPATLPIADSNQEEAREEKLAKLQTPEAQQSVMKFMAQADREAAKLLQDMDEAKRRDALKTLRTVGDPLEVRDGEKITDTKVIARWMKSAPGDVASKFLNGAIYRRLLAEFEVGQETSSESADQVAEQLLKDMSDVSKKRILDVLTGTNVNDAADVERWIANKAGGTPAEQLKNAIKHRLEK